MIIPNERAGFSSFRKSVPEALRAVISLSEDNLPNAVSVATNTAIGTARASIHAIFNNTNSINKPISSPFPKNLSMLLIKKLASNTKSKIVSDKMNGTKCSFNMYLLMIFTKTI